MFCATVSVGTRLISWKIMAMPAGARPRRVTLGERRAVDLDRAGRRGLDAVEDLQDRRLAGAVLAEQRVDLAWRVTSRWTSSSARTPPNAC